MGFLWLLCVLLWRRRACSVPLSPCGWLTVLVGVSVHLIPTYIEELLHNMCDVCTLVCTTQLMDASEQFTQARLSD